MLHVLILLHLAQPAHAQSGVSWATVAAVGSAVAAVVAAGLTAYIFVETRRMRLAQTEPHVGVSVVASEFAFGFADLVIRNDGPGAAIDVRFEPVIDTPGEPDAKLLAALKDLGLVKHGIPYLAPGGEFRTYIAQLIGKDEAALHTYVHLRVKYRSYGHVPYESCYPVELKHFAKRMRVGNPPLHTIARELESLRKEIATLRRAYVEQIEAGAPLSSDENVTDEP